MCIFFFLRVFLLFNFFLCDSLFLLITVFFFYLVKSLKPSWKSVYFNFLSSLFLLISLFQCILLIVLYLLFSLFTFHPLFYYLSLFSCIPNLLLCFSSLTPLPLPFLFFLFCISVYLIVLLTFFHGPPFLFSLNTVPLPLSFHVSYCSTYLLPRILSPLFTLHLSFSSSPPLLLSPLLYLF